MTESGDEQRWHLPDDGPAPAPAAAARPAAERRGRAICWLAVGFAVLGLPTLAAPFLRLPTELVALPALGFGLGWLGVWRLDRAGASGRNIGLVAVRISAVCLVLVLAPKAFDLLML